MVVLEVMLRRLRPAASNLVDTWPKLNDEFCSEQLELERQKEWGGGCLLWRSEQMMSRHCEMCTWHKKEAWHHKV